MGLSGLNALEFEGDAFGVGAMYGRDAQLFLPGKLGAMQHSRDIWGDRIPGAQTHSGRRGLVNHKCISDVVVVALTLTLPDGDKHSHFFNFPQ